MSELFLLPFPIDSSLEDYPSSLSKIVPTLDGIIAESEKSARYFLALFLPKERAYSLPILELSEHTRDEDIALFLPHLKKGRWGLISDAGMPCIADPGAKLVALSYANSISVKSILGPSPIFQALLLSSLPAQRFSFRGYLPRDSVELEREIVSLERLSYKENSVQFFIETPYRSEKMLSFLLKSLRKTTLLCVARDLYLSSEKVVTLPVSKWSLDLIDLKKRPAVFLLYSPTNSPATVS